VQRSTRTKEPRMAVAPQLGNAEIEYVRERAIVDTAWKP
jgi:hypothetical protein